MTRDLIRRFLSGVGVFLLIAVMGELASRGGLLDSQLLPAPSAVAAAFVDGIMSGLFAEHLSATLVRLAYGLALAVAIGVPLGVAIGLSRTLRGVAWPIVVFLYPIPVSVLIPLAIAMFGFATSLYAALVALTAGIPMVMAAADAVQRVSPVLIETGRTLGVRAHRIPLRIVLPAALPALIHGVFVAVSLGVIVLITGEILVSSRGIGHLIVLAQRSYRLPDMYAAVALVGAFGALVTFSTRLPMRSLTTR